MPDQPKKPRSTKKPPRLPKILTDENALGSGKPDWLEDAGQRSVPPKYGRKTETKLSAEDDESTDEA